MQIMELLKIYEYIFCDIISCSPLKGEKYYGVISINLLLLFGIWKNFMICGRSLLLYKFTRNVTELTVVIFVGYQCYQLHTKFYLISFSQNRIHIYG
jgi:hypothetical protein